MKPIIECIPNFSEGINPHIIAAIQSSIENTKGVTLLNVDAGPSANRTVITFVGDPEAVVESAFQAIKTAAQLIDMRTQKGAHPRIGATDLCPLVPIKDISMRDTLLLARALGERVGTELGIPVFLYEYAAKKYYRRLLPDIRKGGYEQIIDKMKQPAWHPDYGPIPNDSNLVQINKTGATVIGARKILVAYNISLDTDDVTIAQNIAGTMRTSGYYKMVNGVKQRVDGHFPLLRCIGWYMESFGHVQVSMNLLDYTVTSPLEVFIKCKELAEPLGVRVLGSELVGLVPMACLLEAGKVSTNNAELTQSEYLNAGVAYLGLNNIKPFNIQEQVLECNMINKGIVDPDFIID